MSNISINRELLIIVVGRLLQMAISATAIIYSASNIGPAEFSKFAKVLLLINIIMLAKDFGYGPLLITNRENKSLDIKNSLSIIFFVWGIFLSILYIISYRILSTHSIGLLDYDVHAIYLVLYFPFFCFASIARIVAERNSQHKPLILADITASTVILAITLLMLRVDKTATVLYLGLIFTVILQSFLYWRIGRFQWCIDITTLKETLSNLHDIRSKLLDNLSFSGSIFLYRYMEPIFIVLYVTAGLFATYSFCQRVITLPSLSLATIVNRYLAAYYANTSDNRIVLSTYRKLVMMSSILSMLFSIAFIIIYQSDLLGVFQKWEQIIFTSHSLLILAVLQFANGNSGVIFNLQHKSRILRSIAVFAIPSILLLNLSALHFFGFREFLISVIVVTSVWTIILNIIVGYALRLHKNFNTRENYLVLLQGCVYIGVVQNAT